MGGRDEEGGGGVFWVAVRGKGTKRKVVVFGEGESGGTDWLDCSERSGE